VWTMLTTVLFIGLNLMGSSVWANERFPREANPGEVQVEVTGMQFAWYFRYRARHHIILRRRIRRRAARRRWDSAPRILRRRMMW